MFTWQLGLLCTAFFFDSPSELKHLSSLTDDTEDEEDAPSNEDTEESEESEIELFKAIHDEDYLHTIVNTFSLIQYSVVFTNQNEWSLYHVDFSTPYSPPEMM